MTSTTVQSLFSDAVRAVERRGGDVDGSLLWPEEAALLGAVVEGRRRDFVNGRWCARRAIVALGAPERPVLRVDDDRAPRWPEGVVGSITHTDGFAAAAVAMSSDVTSVGIDAEPDQPLPPRVRGRIAFDTELEWIDATSVGAGVRHPDRLLFSVKESVYKAWHPVARSWLGFGDVRVEVDGVGGFEVSVLVDGPLDRMRGRYVSLDGVIVAAVEVRSGRG